MPAAISVDLRQRIVRDCDAGVTTTQVAAKFSVSVPFVKKSKWQRAMTGSIEPKPQGGGRRRALASRVADIRRIVDQGHAATVAEVHEQLAACSTKTA